MRARKTFVIAACAALAVLAFLVFAPCLRHDFVNYDDEDYFSANRHVEAGLTGAGIRWAFETTYASNWHPMTWLSLMLDAQVFGTGPFGPHLGNVLLHSANTALLFLLLVQITGAGWRSAFVAALFAIHPLHVESVAWVSERKDALSGLFFMLTLLFYAIYAGAANRQARSASAAGQAARSPDHPSPLTLRRWHYYGLALLCFGLGLMSKSMLVTVPFVLLLLDFWPLERAEKFDARSAKIGSSRADGTPALPPHRVSSLRGLIVEKLPFFALSIASSVITLLAQREAVQPLSHISMAVRAVNAINSYSLYLAKMVWPAGLAIPYPHPGYGMAGQAFVSSLILGAVTVAALRFRAKFPFLLTGWFWYVGMLIPVIGLVQVGMQPMADRYTYLPLIGIFIAIVWGADACFKSFRLGRIPAGAGGAVVLAVLAARTTDQLGFWENSETLFQHAIAVTRSNDTAYYNLGEFYLKAGRLDEAIGNFREAIRIRPDYDDALSNLGVALALEGQLDEAKARILEAIRCEPGKADAYYNLGNVFVRQRDLASATNLFTKALQLRPDYPEAENNLATALLILGHREAAIQHYREALRLDPAHENAKRQLRALGALPAQ